MSDRRASPGTRAPTVRSNPPSGDVLSVLHVAQPTEAGVPLCVVQLIRDQCDRDWKAAVACPEGGDLAAAVTATGAEHFSWRAHREPGPATIFEVWRLREIVTSFNPDVVHLHSAKAGLAGRLAIRGARPTIYQPHAWSFHAASGPMRTAALSWERWAGRRWSDLIVCVSEQEKAEAVTRRIQAPWAVVPNGIDLERWNVAMDKDAHDARASLGLGSDPIVVCVGRLSRHKGQDVLLDSWPLVLRRVPEAQLVLVGDGPDRAALESRNVPRSRLVGGRPDVDKWLAAANVVVVASRWEGMSMAMLEAMASGRSVVSTDVAGAREAVGTSAGAVVPVGDPIALGDAIALRLADDELRRREGEAARARVEADYDVRTTTGAIAALYREVLERRAT